MIIIIVIMPLSLISAVVQIINQFFHVTHEELEYCCRGESFFPTKV